MRGRGNSRGEPDRVAPLSRRPAGSDGDPRTALLGALAAPDPPLGQSEARVCGGVSDVSARPCRHCSSRCAPLPASRATRSSESRAHVMPTWRAVGECCVSPAFTYAIGGALVLFPVVWLHYLVVLAVPLAISRPRFSMLWLLPIILWVSPRAGNGDGVETLLPAVVASILVASVVAERGAERDSRAIEARRRDAATGGVPSGWNAGDGTACARAADRSHRVPRGVSGAGGRRPLRECARERLRRHGPPTVSLGRGRDPRRREPVPAARRAARGVGRPVSVPAASRAARDSAHPVVRSRPRVCW